MSLSGMNKKRAIVITGQHGCGKSTMARKLLPEAIVIYANEMNIKDVNSLPLSGIIIEDIHYKPIEEEIINVLYRYRGEVILTCLRQKLIPNRIKKMCNIKRAGNKNYIREAISNLAPRGEEPESFERDTFSLVMDYLKDSDRNNIVDLLKFNKPADTQIISWLSENIHPNKLVFIDGVVKRRWSTDYFYEMLGYAHDGRQFGRVQFPKRREYSKVPNLCKRLGLKPSEERLYRQLIQEESFKKNAMSKLNNMECRLMGLGEKRTPKTKSKTIKQMTLGDF
tara:strand:- start:310 stop:1152 length:843 start_codon:yes stop_codon:yes gene_type:complete